MNVWLAVMREHISLSGTMSESARIQNKAIMCKNKMLSFIMKRLFDLEVMSQLKPQYFWQCAVLLVRMTLIQKKNYRCVNNAANMSTHGRNKGQKWSSKMYVTDCKTSLRLELCWFIQNFIHTALILFWECPVMQNRSDVFDCGWVWRRCERNLQLSQLLLGLF